MRAFSGLAPSKLNFFPKKLTVGYVYIEESFEFDTIFNMGYGSGNSPMAERVNQSWFEFEKLFTKTLKSISQ